VTDPAVTPTINPGDTYDYTFLAPLNLSASGAYSIEVNVGSSLTDPVTLNNKLIKVFQQLNNPPISLPFTDNIDVAIEQTLKEKQIGLQGLDRYDFVNSSTSGRLRTFINSGLSYSGNRAITLDADKYNAGNTDSLTGTYNLPSVSFNANTDDIRLDFRYKNHGQTTNAANKVWVRGTDLDNWIEVFDLAANQNEVDGSYKLSASIQVSDFLKNALPPQNYSSSFQVRWGQFGLFSAADNEGYAGYSFDDIRLYKVTDDLQLMSIDEPIVNSCNLGTAIPVKITIKNNSETAIPASPGIPVRYRINNGTWVNETINTGIAANTSYQYTFSNTADLSVTGSYFLEAEVVYSSDTYKENDTLSRTIVNTPTIIVTNSTPYLQDFELSNGYWYAAGKNSSWEYGTPASYKINRAANGIRAWKTGKSGNYKDAEKSYLYSPCFDIAALSNPTLSFSLALDLEDCGAGLCDGAYLEYSVNGAVWQRLGANGQGTNWYNKNYAGNNLWSVENYHRWHVATLPLTVLPAPLSQYTRIQFRFAVSSDAYVNREGIAIDDIHIYSNPYGIYDGLTMGSPVSANIPGNTGWVDFTSGGKLVASVNSPIQSMGNTDVQAYINTAAVRTNSGQYYHDRNITIKPTAIDLGSDSATVRFYFLDAETETLLNATGCATCYKPSMAYELGVSKYSDPNDFYEDGVVENSLAVNGWKFINNSKIRMVPFDKGYYAEFKVKDFSEFWLNNGGFDSNHPLPVQLISFTAQKMSGSADVITKWKTASELNVSRFEIEVARGNSDYQLNRFSKIGEINSQGNSVIDQEYSFIDQEAYKSGIRYYRLKIIDIDGSFKYSAIRPVVFNDEIKWQVTPNPSSGIFNLIYQGATGEAITIKVYDANGKVVIQNRVFGTGFVEKQNIGLNSNQFANGFYLLEVSTGTRKQTFKLIKQ
ncbi:MAG: T9SS type A sorting domain-containing protein, partial [Chitinophagaceae bacterium]